MPTPREIFPATPSFPLAREGWAGQLELLPTPRSLPPLLADCGQVVRESERRAAAVIPHHHLNIAVRKSDAGIDGRDALVIPVRDLAEENIGVNRAGEFQMRRQPLGAVGQDNAASGHGNQDRSAFDGGNLLVGEGGIAGSEIDGALQEPLRALAAANDIVVNDHVGMFLVVLFKPLAKQGCRQKSNRLP